jgi:acetyltransferase-like isoleucine patch superfamily enzyme
MHTSKVVLGQSPWLEMAAEDWLLVEPGVTIRKIEVDMDRQYAFDLAALAEIDPQSCTAFVAWGSEFLNFQRHEMWGELKQRGVRMPPLVHPAAHVSPSATIQENVWVQAHALIGPQATVGLNAHIGLGARIGAHAQLGNHAWIGQDSRVGVGAHVEAHATLGDGVVVADAVRIGRQAYIEVAGVVREDWPEKAFWLSRSGLRGQIVDH